MGVSKKNRSAARPRSSDTSKAARPRGGSSHLFLASLPGHERRKLLDAFARRLQEFLKQDKVGKHVTKDIMKGVSEEFGRNVDPRQFYWLLQALKRDDLLDVHFRREDTLSANLRRKYERLREVTVVSGDDQEWFALAGAQDFVTTLRRIAEKKANAARETDARVQGQMGQVKCVLNIGLVSGGTCGSIVRAAANVKSWQREFGFAFDRIHTVRIFALNVCLTTPEHLHDNATVLAHQLGEKIRKEAPGDVKVLPFGLSAPLAVEWERLREVDSQPQTINVVQETEPRRVWTASKNDPQEKGPAADHTELDVILTGVGQEPPRDNQGSKSIFYILAEAMGFKPDEVFRRRHVVGDIAFTPIDSEGQEVALVRDEVRWMFYSAVRLDVLRAMAQDDKKAVILAARHDENAFKIPAIQASIGVLKPCASHLIVDAITASRLQGMPH